MPNQPMFTRALKLATALAACAVFVGCSAETLALANGGDGGAPGITSDGPLSSAQLARLRGCESGGNYRAVSRSGTYRGAYQFSRSTWNGVASRHHPEFVGVDPAAAPPIAQDAMTQRLWAERGRSPWPVCGRKV